MNAALSLAAELQHPFTTAFASFHAGLLHLWRRDFDTVLDRVGSLLKTAGEYSFAIWNAAGVVLEGAARVGLGGSEDGLANLRRGMDLYQGLRSPPIFWPILLGIHATDCHHAGQPAEGLASVEAAIAILGAGAGTMLLSELQIVKGDLLLARAIAEGREGREAEDWYRMAFERASRLNAGISKLRAATRLCRVSTTAGRDAARRVLAEVHATFTEGATSRDLREARELLDAP